MPRLQALQLLPQVHPAIRDLPILLRELLAHGVAFRPIYPQLREEHLQQIALEPAHQLHVNRQRNVVCEALICDWYMSMRQL